MAIHVLITYRSAAAFDPALKLYRKLSEDGYAPYLDTQGAYAGDSAQIQAKVSECSDVLFVLATGTFEEGSEDDGFSTAAACAAQKKKNMIAVTLPGFAWPVQPDPAAEALRGCACVDASARSFDELYSGVRALFAYKAKAPAAAGKRPRLLPIILALCLVLLAAAGGLALKFGLQKGDRTDRSEGSAPAVTLVPTATATFMPAADEPTEAPAAAAVPTHASTATPVPTAAPTHTPVPTAAPTATPVPTAVPTHTPTPTPAPTQAATPVPDLLERGEEVEFGWYGDAPIRWTVLDSDIYATRLISQECIACRPYGSSTDWYTSSLRIWLNDYFAWEAFNEAEINALHYTEDDLVRIPTVADMTNPDYGFSTDPDRKDASRGAKAGRTAKQQGVWVNEDNGRCSYFTMTPNNSTSMKQIRSDGRVGFASVDRDNVGVRIIIRVSTGYLQ